MSSSTWSDRKASTNSRATDFMSKRELDDILGVHMTNILFDPKSEASQESYEQLPTQLLGYTIAERCKNYVKSVKGALRDFACGNIDGAKQAFDEVEVPWSSESESTASSTSSSSNHTKAPVGRGPPGPPPPPGMMRTDGPNTSASTQRGMPGRTLTPGSGKGGAEASRPPQPGTTAQQPRPYAGQTAPSQSNASATGYVSSQAGPFTKVPKPGASDQRSEGPQTNTARASGSGFSNARSQPPGTQNQSAAPSWQSDVPQQSQNYTGSHYMTSVFGGVHDVPVM